MKNKFARIISILCMLQLICGSFVCADNESTKAGEQLQLGDYFTLGKYNEDPILWRYVADDENGKLILSDKIICFKAFDVIGENNQGSHARTQWRSLTGNNYWGDSNIRSWLNSCEPAGNVVWMCGNPPDSEYSSVVEERLKQYAKEKGFLADGNFTETERYAIKEVTQKSLLDMVDAELADGGSAEVWNELGKDSHWMTTILFGTSTIYADGKTIFGDLINPAENRYDELCFEYTTDKMFLMDIKQCWTVHDNESILGDRYCHAKSTQQALDQVDETYYTEDKEIPYYLRTPYGREHQFNRDSSSLGDKILTDSGHGRYTKDFEGIRPAFYLNEDTAMILSGSGTEEAPYVVNGSGEKPDDNGGENPSIISVFCNGSEIFFDQPPVMENDRVLVPMRGIFEALGAEITWDGETQTVTAVRGDCTIEVQIGSSVMLKNGEPIPLETVPRLENDRTLVPVRAVSEGLDAKVDWIADLQRVVVDTME